MSVFLLVCRVFSGGTLYLALSGGSLGTPWEPPGAQGHEIDDSGRRFRSIFDLQSIKFDSKSTLRASQKRISSYIVELDEPNRLR